MLSEQIEVENVDHLPVHVPIPQKINGRPVNTRVDRWKIRESIREDSGLSGVDTPGNRAIRQDCLPSLEVGGQTTRAGNPFQEAKGGQMPGKRKKMF